MFTVPAHLPRAPATPSGVTGQPDQSKPDRTLDLLAPFLDSSPASAGPSRWTAGQATGVREKLEQAVKENKARSHQLLLDNFSTISSHIQLADALREQHGRIASRLASLEGQIDPSNLQTSFLPPVISQLNRHFTATNRRSRAAAHVKALKALQKQAERVEELEKAIWGGKGAEGWVVAALSQAEGGPRAEDEGIAGTKVSSAIQTRIQLFRSMLLEQLSDAFSSAVSLTAPKSGKGETTLRVSTETKLQQPRIPRPEDRSHPSQSSEPSPDYPLAHIYTTLSQLGTLPPLLEALSSRILRDLVRPLLEHGSKYRLTSVSPSASSAELRLSSSPTITTPADKISGSSFLLEFLSTSLFPSSPSSELPERHPFISRLTHQILNDLLQTVIIPAMPATIAGITEWLNLLTQAAQLESTLAVMPDKVIQPFVEERAGQEWVHSRSRAALEEVKQLVLGGWGGWDGMEAKREREVSVLVEVEEDETTAAVIGTGKEKTEAVEVDGDEDGWGLDSPIASTHPDIPALPRKEEGTAADPVVVDAEEDAWGFDDDDKPEDAPVKAKSAMSVSVAKADADEPDGWEFDLDASKPAAAASASVKPAKPVREAKKLGKKVARAKQAEADAMADSGFGNEDEQMSSGMSGMSTPASSSEARSGQEGDGWGWDEPAQPPPVAPQGLHHEKSAELVVEKQAAAKRMVTRQERRVVEESYLVSKACEKLLGLVGRCLAESRELESSSLPASFTAPAPQLARATSTLLDTFRALIPLTSTQIADVPTLSMQLVNDFSYIASRLPSLDQSNPSSPGSTTYTASGQGYDWGMADQQRRLSAFAESTYESQLRRQVDGLMELLDEAQGWDGTGLAAGSRRCEGAIRGVKERIDSLGRVLKLVMPASAYYPTLGYLIDTTVKRISAEVLALPDITEVESEKLDELLKVLQPLEDIFEGAEPPTSIVSHAPHWLKYNYISELLHANLVDITYLFDTGALVDFTTEELVGVIKALFADSEKRDGAIERIERGRGTQGEGAGNLGR